MQSWKVGLCLAGVALIVASCRSGEDLESSAADETRQQVLNDTGDESPDDPDTTAVPVTTETSVRLTLPPATSTTAPSSISSTTTAVPVTTPSVNVV